VASPPLWTPSYLITLQLSSGSPNHGEVGMNRLPLIGEGVLVPWGVDQLPGEVVDVLPPDHAVVEVPVEGTANDVGSTSVRVRTTALVELPLWRVVRTRHGKPSPGADATGAWWIDAERGNDRAQVEVRLSGTAASMPPALMVDETREGVRTKGRSAVEKYAWRFRLPQVIVLGASGAFELAE
jgi:hypothetical protein